MRVPPAGLRVGGVVLRPVRTRWTYTIAFWTRCAQARRLELQQIGAEPEKHCGFPTVPLIFTMPTVRVWATLENAHRNGCEP